MVSSIVGVCFYRFVEKRPDLFFIPGKIESVEDVEKYKMIISHRIWLRKKLNGKQVQYHIFVMVGVVILDAGGQPLM